MNRAELLTKVTEILADAIDDETLHLEETTTAEDVPDWDSNNHVRLIIGIESAFGIRFETDEIGAPENVGQLLDLIEKKLGR